MISFAFLHASPPCMCKSSDLRLRLVEMMCGYHVCFSCLLCVCFSMRHCSVFGTTFLLLSCTCAFFHPAFILCSFVLRLVPLFPLCVPCFASTSLCWPPVDGFACILDLLCPRCVCVGAPLCCCCCVFVTCNKSHIAAQRSSQVVKGERRSCLHVYEEFFVCARAVIVRVRWCTLNAAAVSCY